MWLPEFSVREAFQSKSNETWELVQSVDEQIFKKLLEKIFLREGGRGYPTLENSMKMIIWKKKKLPLDKSDEQKQLYLV